MADGSEGVAEFAIFGGGVADAVGGEQRKIQRAGDGDGGAVAGFFFALEMALQFDVDISAAENSDELIDRRRASSMPPCCKAAARGPSAPPVRQIRPWACSCKFFFADCAFAFFGAQLHFGDQAAEILIAGAGGDEKGKAEEQNLSRSGARNPDFMIADLMDRFSSTPQVCNLKRI